MTSPIQTESRGLRFDAVRALQQIEESGAYVGLARRGKTSNPELERRLTDLVSGVTRWKRYLDFVIDSFHSKEGQGLERQVRLILRVGVYELLMTNTPVHAVVNESVEWAKKMVGKRVGGLVNAILRNVDRQRDRLAEPSTGSQSQDLAIRYSHPTWMVERWMRRFGVADTIRLLEHNNERPGFGLRVRGGSRNEILEAFGEEMGVKASEFLEDFLRTRTLQPVLRSGLVERGRVLVQDEAAGGIVRVLDPKPGERILDACAAPGGKSLYIADLMEGIGSLVSVDLHEGRLGLLSKEAERLGIGNIDAITSDLRALSPDRFTSLFDRVLLDAPCSGLGVLGKRADLRWKRGEDGIAELARLQSELLEAAARFVAPGGLLVYSTCTLEPEENEVQVHRFLDQNDHYKLEPIVHELPDVLITDEGMYLSLPFRDGMDGAFAARLRRGGIVP